MMKRLLIATVLGAALGAGPARASAQVTVFVDPLDPAYEWLAALRSEGLIRSALTAQRPISRGEFARLAAEGRARRDSVPGVPLPAHVVEALDALSAEFAPASSPRPIDMFRMDATQLSSDHRAVRNGELGYIDAATNPLAENRQGEPVARGFNARAESEHSVGLGRHLALLVRPAAWASTGAPPAARRSGVELRRASAVVGFANVRVQAGRDFVSLGRGLTGGLGVSHNAPPFDMIRVASDEPFRLPWILGAAGPIRASAFVADLGPNQNFPHARLAAAKASVAPHRRLELGVVLIQHVGGEGSPPATAAEKFVDFFPLIDAIFLGDRDLLFSNKLSGADFRLTLPGRAELYGELLFDDFDLRRVRSTFWEDAGSMVGLSVPGLLPDRSLRIDAEAHHMGLRMFQHYLFVSGVTRDRHIIGNPLGARANAGYLRLTKGQGGRAPLALTLAVEDRSDDQYIVTVEDERDNGWRFIRTEVRPREHRLRGVLEWNPEVAHGVRLGVALGAERVSNFEFEAGRRTLGGLARFGLTRRF